MKTDTIREKNDFNSALTGLPPTTDDNGNPIQPTKPQPQAGTRLDFKTEQYVPTVDGKDVSPTSFDKARALQIAQEHTAKPQPQHSPLEKRLQRARVAIIGDSNDEEHDALVALVEELENYNNHADKLAEALRLLLREPTELSAITHARKTLAAYEADRA